MVFKGEAMEIKKHTPETQFSEILNLMNKLQLPFSYFTLFLTRFSEQTQFSKQKGSDNHIH